MEDANRKLEDKEVILNESLPFTYLL